MGLGSMGLRSGVPRSTVKPIQDTVKRWSVSIITEVHTCGFRATWSLTDLIANDMVKWSYAYDHSVEGVKQAALDAAHEYADKLEAIEASGEKDTVTF